MNKTSIILFLLISSFYANAQRSDKPDWSKMGNNRGFTFYEVQQNFYEYWLGKKIEKGKGYKVFKRWEAYMAPRVYPSGNMLLPSTDYERFLEWQRERPVAERTETANWTELGPIGKPGGPTVQTGAGRVNFIRFDPLNSNTIYVGAPDGGLWKSTNAGASWTINSNFLTIIGCSDLAIEPGNTNIMYLATGDVESDRRSIGVLKSTDGGTTWNTTALTWTATDNYKISKLLMHPANPDIMLISTDGGVFRTTDGWATFSQTSAPFNLKDMEFKPGDPNIVYAAGTVFIKSTDNGLTWTPNTTDFPAEASMSRIALGISPDNPAYVYALIGKSADQSFLGLYRSTDSGTSFTERSNSPNLLGYLTDGSDNGGQAFYDLSIAVSPLNAEKVITGGVNQWGSIDGGASWTNLTHWNGDDGRPFVHADVHDLVFLPGSGTTFFSGNDGGIFKTIDNGISWTDLSSNLAMSQQTKIGLSADVSTLLITGHQDNGTNVKSGASWINIFGGDGGECFFDYSDNNTIYLSYVNGEMNRSDDGGMTTNLITTGIPFGGGSGADFYSSYHQDPVTPTTLYAGGRPAFYKSTDKGDSWTALGTPVGILDNITDFVVAPGNTSIIYAIKYNTASISTDGGANWTDVTGTLPVGNASLSNLTISNIDPNIVWVTFSGYSDGEKVFKTTDGGASWANISAGLPNLPINTIVFQNGTGEIYVGADIGVYYYNNSLSAWESFSTNLPNCAVRDLEIFYPAGKLRAGTYGRGAWESDLVSALPVELLTFQVQLKDKNTGLLTWTTASEQNNKGFEIQWMHGRNGTFETTGFVEAKGGNGQNTYAFEQKNLAPGEHYFRLKQLDNDGSFEFSPVKSLLIRVPFTVSLSPNPVQHELLVNVLMEEKAAFSISLANAAGQVTELQRSRDIPKGNTEFRFDLSNYPAGVYFCIFKTEKGAEETVRIVKK